MTKVQGACLGLMAEIQAICDENGLRVYLIDKQLWASQTTGQMVGYEADVAMFYGDFVKLRSAVEKRYGDRREIESYEENQSMPGVYYRYVDVNTTFFDLDTFKLYRKQGIYVNIHIIRSSGMDQNLLSVYEWAMGRGLQRSRRASLYGCLVSVACRVTGDRFQTKKILEHFEKARVEGPGRTEIKLPMGKRLVFPQGFWDGQGKCDLNGYTFTTVRKPKDYLSIQFGPDWEDKTVKGKKETYMCIGCTNLPYRKYWDYVGEDMVDDEFLSKREKFMSADKENIKDYNSQTKQAWSVFFSIEDQFRQQKKIEDYKDDVIDTWNSGHHDNAMLLMGTYVDKIDEYRKEKVALVADDDLWELYMQWLLENGKDGIESKLREILKKGQLEGR